MNAMSTEMNDMSEESLEERYNKMVNDLVSNNGFSPRKARRYLDSMAKRNMKKFMKQNNSQTKIDTSDIDPQNLPDEEI